MNKTINQSNSRVRKCKKKGKKKEELNKNFSDPTALQLSLSRHVAALSGRDGHLSSLPHFSDLPLIKRHDKNHLKVVREWEGGVYIIAFMRKRKKEGKYCEVMSLVRRLSEMRWTGKRKYGLNLLK